MGWVDRLTKIRFLGRLVVDMFAVMRRFTFFGLAAFVLLSTAFGLQGLSGEESSDVSSSLSVSSLLVLAATCLRLRFFL